MGAHFPISGTDSASEWKLLGLIETPHSNLNDDPEVVSTNLVRVELALDAGAVCETDRNHGGVGDAIWGIPELNVPVIVFLVEFLRMSTYQLVNTI